MGDGSHASYKRAETLRFLGYLQVKIKLQDLLSVVSFRFYLVLDKSLKKVELARKPEEGGTLGGGGSWLN